MSRSSRNPEMRSPSSRYAERVDGAGSCRATGAATRNDVRHLTDPAIFVAPAGVGEHAKEVDPEGKLTIQERAKRA